MNRIAKLVGRTAATSASMAGELTITINSDEPRNSPTRIAVYDSPAEFPEGNPIRKVSLRPGSEPVVTSFENLEPGTYAIAAFIDANSDGELEKNFLGVPIEPYGFSGEKFFGPPSFDKAKFELGDDDQTITVELH